MGTIACSGAILAGGLNTRMGGKNKALLSIGGKKILEHLKTALDGLFSELLLVTNSPLETLSWDRLMVADLICVRSSLTGVHAGVFHGSCPYVFVTACDTPFLRPELVSFLLGQVGPRWDVVIPETEKGLQPLCAIYSKQCLKPIEEQLTKESPRIVDFFPSVRVKKIPEEQLRQADPELVSFFNVNTPQDLAVAEKIWSQIMEKEMPSQGSPPIL
jgi:molybdopterin-guanine dinucleotide biosynthesis protein A